MNQLGGRRRNLHTERWIEYVAFFRADEGGGTVQYSSILRDDVGTCDEAPEGVIAIPAGATPDEAVRAALCRFIDTVLVAPGQPAPDPLWALKHVLRGGRL